ncbi:hypothetical protein C8R45DRAFT_1031640, partial [Mycena sanguinolenta]
MCWGREGTHGAWLVHLREREGKREAERAEGGACRSRSGRTVARRARRVRSTSIADTTTALTLEVRLCVGVEGMYLVGLVRRVETNRIDGASAVRYLAAFFTVARLCRVVVLTMRGPSCSSPTSGGASPARPRPPMPLAQLWCAPDRCRPLGARVPPPHLPLPPLALIPRQAVVTANAHEKTVVDGQKTIVIRRRPLEARGMLVE